jgi:hypothetical protein
VSIKQLLSQELPVKFIPFARHASHWAFHPVAAGAEEDGCVAGAEDAAVSVDVAAEREVSVGDAAQAVESNSADKIVNRMGAKYVSARPRI